MAAVQEVNEFRPPARTSSSTTGNLARELSLPQAEPPRPHRRPKSAPRKRGKGFVLSAFWVFTLAIALLLVHQNSLVLREKAAITEARSELARLEKKNQEQEAQLVQLTSVADIERWALARNMQRPASAKALSPDPSAVARKSATPQPSTADVAQAEPAGLWGAVKGYVNLFTGILSTKSVR